MSGGRSEPTNTPAFQGGRSRTKQTRPGTRTMIASRSDDVPGLFARHEAWAMRTAASEAAHETTKTPKQTRTTQIRITSPGSGIIPHPHRGDDVRRCGSANQGRIVNW